MGSGVCVNVGSGVEVCVGVCEAVALGVGSSSPAGIICIAPKVSPADTKENSTRKKRATGTEREICARCRPVSTPPFSFNSVPHTTHCVALSETLVPHVGQIWLSGLETSDPCSVMCLLPNNHS